MVIESFFSLMESGCSNDSVKKQKIIYPVISEDITPQVNHLKSGDGDHDYEHLSFLMQCNRNLEPLRTVSLVAYYHFQLSYCVKDELINLAGGH